LRSFTLYENSGTGVSSLQAQAEACGNSFAAAEGGGATFSCFVVTPKGSWNVYMKIDFSL
jgi:hypothetical protein